ncbi:MAG: NAD(P)/FAD-dependent oxidoreductase [Brevibacillus sp.]|nr:NAD(P)/FAD-dependent oxidoreductase [Brevibacillus sp.]
MLYDTIVIGGGIAGLQAAIQLGRSLRRVLVIDKEAGRSVVAKNYRNILGFPDGVSGPELRKRGMQQAVKLGVELKQGEVVELVRDTDGIFVVTTADQSRYRARTLLAATGLTDAFPPVPGLTECLGESIFICPDCDGYEVRAQPTLVIGAGKELIHMSRRLCHYTRQQTLVVHGVPAVDGEQLIELEKTGFPWYCANVTAIDQRQGQLQAVELANGIRLQARKAFLANPGGSVNNELLQPFSVKILPSGHVLVDPRTKETSCRNIWAVGDLVAHSQMAAVAMGDGAQAAIWINKRLMEPSEVSPPPTE